MLFTIPTSPRRTPPRPRRALRQFCERQRCPRPVPGCPCGGWLPGTKKKAWSLNSQEETPNPRRDSEKTGRWYTSKTLLHMVSLCFLGVSSWVWSLYWEIIGYGVGSGALCAAFCRRRRLWCPRRWPDPIMPHAVDEPMTLAWLHRCFKYYALAVLFE